MSDLRQQIVSSLRPADVDALSDDFVVALSHRLGLLLSQASPAPEPDGWLDFAGALERLGMKKGTLYKLASSRTISFHQDGPGSKLWLLPKCFHEPLLGRALADAIRGAAPHAGQASTSIARRSAKA